MRARSMILISLLVATAACTGDERRRAPEKLRQHRSLRTSSSSALQDGTVIVGSRPGSCCRPAKVQVACAGRFSPLRDVARRRIDESRGARLRRPATSSPPRRLRGPLDVRAASLTGRAVALMRPLPAGVDPTYALPRTHTTIVVADPTGEGRTRRYRLRGTSSPRPSRSTTPGCS